MNRELRSAKKAKCIQPTKRFTFPSRFCVLLYLSVAIYGRAAAPTPHQNDQIFARRCATRFPLPGRGPVSTGSKKID